jgi:hypothetical protein
VLHSDATLTSFENLRLRRKSAKNATRLQINAPTKAL